MPKALGDFKNLQESKPQISKVSNEKLLEYLSKEMHTTKEVAAFLGVENGTAFSRLKRMEKNGVATRGWEGNRSWWVARTAVGLPVLAPVEEEKVEEAVEAEETEEGEETEETEGL